MQPHTGQTYEIPTGLDGKAHVGSTFTAPELTALREKLEERGEPLGDVPAAVRSAREHGPLVGVTGQVAHAQQLGRRELDRRRRRRKAARDARRQNR